MVSRTPLLLEGAFNFRDLGGLRVQGGRQIRYGRVFRSDTLQMLTLADVETLVDQCKIRSVVDLRLVQEAREEGRGLLGDRAEVRYFNSPFEMASAEGLAPDQILDHLYAQCLISPSLPRAIESIAEHVDQPIVFHCAAGKDRTGVVAAMLLALVGAETESIVADYMRSKAAMPRIVVRFKSWPRYRQHMAVMPPLVYEAVEGSIRRLLTRIETDYGDARAWAKQVGIPHANIIRLQNALVG